MANEIGVPPRQLAEKLKDIYEQPFGGKKRGRFRTSRQNIRRLAKSPVLTDSYIHAVYEELLYFDLILINIDSALRVPRNDCQGISESSRQHHGKLFRCG